MKSTKKKTTKKAATKGRAGKPDHVSIDAEVEIDRIAGEHGDIGNAAQNFYYTVNFSPAFLRDATLKTLNAAAEKLNLPPFTDEGDDVEQFERLVNLFEATGGEFTLAGDERASDERADGKLVTFEQARAFGHHLAMRLGDNGEIGDVLLFIRALVFHEGREHLMHEITAGMMPIVSGFDRVVKELVLRQANDWDRMHPPKK